MLGLPPASLGRLTGLGDVGVANALADAPEGDLGAFLTIVERLGARLIVRPGPDLRAAVPLATVDALISNDAYRKSRGLWKWMRSRTELKRQIGVYRKLGKSYNDLVDALERNWIPTAEGLRRWRPTTVAQILAQGRNQDGGALPIKVGEEVRLKWREYVATGLIVDLCEFNPATAVQYALTARLEPDHLVIASGAPIPDAVRLEMLHRFDNLRWVKTPPQDSIDAPPSDTAESAP